MDDDTAEGRRRKFFGELKNSVEIKVVGLAYELGLDGMELLKTKDHDELLIMSAALEAAAEARRKQNEALAEHVGYQVWKQMPKIGS